MVRALNRVKPLVVVSLLAAAPRATEAKPRATATRGSPTKIGKRPPKPARGPTGGPSVTKIRPKAVGGGKGAGRRIGLANPPPDCGVAKILEVLALATADKPEVRIDCNVRLGSANIEVTKRVALLGDAATGVTFDCNGATLKPTYPHSHDSKGRPRWRAVTVGSVKRADGSWSRPQHVTVKRCNMQGAGVYIHGWNSKTVTRRSSRQLGHTERAQAVGARFITFDHVTINDPRGNGFYFGVGVTRSRLIHSEIKGNGDGGVAIYLDAESARNRVEKSYIHLSHAREQIAIDGSANNRIVGNRLSGLNTGGIYVYRNCGEDGIVRHLKPRRNQIINNIFYYNKYTGDNPSVWLASRNGSRGFCDLDSAYNFGSGKSDLDYAQHNVVAESRIYKRNVSDMIREDASPNYYYRNKTVSSATVRKSGCYSHKNGVRQFVGHGENMEVFVTSNGIRVYRCGDNRLLRTKP